MALYVLCVCVCVSQKTGGGRHAAGRGSVAAADAGDYMCPSSSHLFKSIMDFAHHVRSPLKNMVQQLCPKPLHRYVLCLLKCLSVHFYRDAYA